MAATGEKAWVNIVVEPWGKLWQLPHAKKMSCLGPAVRPVGGRPRIDTDADIMHDVEEGAMAIKEDTLVPRSL